MAPRTRFRALAPCVMLLALAGCKRARTEIVARIDTDMEQGPEATLTAIRVQVTSQDEDTPRLDTIYVLGAQDPPLFLPAELGIVPRDESNRVVRVDVTALQGDTELFVRRSIATFAPGRTLLLDIFLADRCRIAANQVCPEGSTCGATGCESIERMMLPDFGADAGLDAAGTCADTPCPGGCTSLETDAHNCGACGHDCTALPNVTAGVSCSAGLCEVAAACAPGFAHCSTNPDDGCETDLTTATDCGACGVDCAPGQACVAGECACPLGLSPCDGSCVDLLADLSHCGTCTVACTAGESCTLGACNTGPPANDARAGAIDVVAAVTTTLGTSTIGAHNDTAGPATCSCTAGADVFYRLTVAQPEIVYADTIGSAFDTGLFLQDESGSNLVGGSSDVTCSNDACGTTQSQLAARLDAGIYYLVLSGCTPGMGTLRVQRLPAGNGANTAIAAVGTATVTGTTAGTGLFRIGGGSCGNGGPEDVYWFTTCPSPSPVVFHATTCGGGTQYDTILVQQSAGRTPLDLCNDDYCGFASSVSGLLPASGGLHALYVDGYDAGGTSALNAGSYTARVAFDACVSGSTLCTDTCRDLMIDIDACGDCTMQCNMNNERCFMGGCLPRPDGDVCNQPVGITLGPPGTVTTVMGSTAGAASSYTGCDVMGADLNYELNLAERELVYLDTFGSPTDTGLGINDPTGCNGLTPATVCNEDACGGRQSRLAVVLEAGRHLVVVDTSPSGIPGAFTLHIQHMPVPGPVDGTLSAGAFSVTTNTTGAPARAFSCNATTGGERFYSFLTCPAYPGGAFAADTCASASFDTVLELRHGNAAGVCDDNGAACSAGRSQLATSVPAGAGVHVLSVAGAAGSAGSVTISGTRP